MARRLMLINKGKQIYNLVNYARSVDHRVKMKESKKILMLGYCLRI